MLHSICSYHYIQIVIHVSVLPYLTGPERKEVSYEAGSDGTLTCDVVGSPITFEWRDKNDKLIHNGTVLYVPDILQSSSNSTMRSCTGCLPS
jgi:hypothetical protein